MTDKYTDLTAAHECLQAVEYAANHIDDPYERGEFIRAWAQGDDLATDWPEYVAWRAGSGK